MTNGSVAGANAAQDILFGQKPSETPKVADQLSSKDTFLKLLVAQMKYQDPTKPTDGIQFLSQLAQFTDLEQSMAMNEELAAIRKLLEQQAQPAPPQTNS
jgi:flagellar basal-body rod modification protein FlgD